MEGMHCGSGVWVFLAPSTEVKQMSEVFGQNGLQAQIVWPFPEGLWPVPHIVAHAWYCGSCQHAANDMA
eukprot:scaffold189404_cov18-Tisochrysis_lutea.AAC.3